MPRLISLSPLFFLGAALSACVVDGVEPVDEGAGAFGFEPAGFDEALPDVDATGYDVELSVSDLFGSETFRATVTGSYVATSELRELALDFEGHTLDDVRVNGAFAAHRRDGPGLA